MRINLKRGINRMFVVLTAAWVIYCLFVYPIQQRLHAENVLHSELRDCYEHELGKGAEFQSCLQYAEIKAAVDTWSLKAYYARESWLLGLIVILVPILAYALSRGLLLISLWVWRGFTSASSSP